MSDFEFNKIFAAVLIAGITVWMSGFIANKLVHPEKLKKNAVEIEGGEVAGGGGPKKAQLPEPILHLIAAADVTRGEKLAKACVACHSFANGGAHKVGPNLWDIMNAPKAGKAGFGYSTALKEHGGAWSYAELNKFLWKPKKHIPGTKMNYNGIKKPEDRAAMVAWLRTLASSPDPLPNQFEINQEKAELTPPEPEAEAVAPAAP